MSLDLVFQMPVFLHGGVERYYMTLIRGFQQLRLGLKIGVALVGQWNTMRPAVHELLSLGVTVIGGPSGDNPEIISTSTEKEAWDWISEARNIVLWGSPIPKKWAPIPGNRTIGISHGDGAWTRSWLWDKYDVCLAVSEPAGRCFPRFHNVGGAIDFNRVSPTGENIRAQLNIRHWETTVGYLGRFSAEKGLDVMVPMLANTPGIRKVAMGKGFERDQLGQDWLVLENDECNVGDFFETINVLLIPSPAEGMPLVALEAMYNKVPVIIRPGVGCIDEIEKDLAMVVTTKFRPDQLSLSDHINRALQTDKFKLELARDYVMDHCTPGKLARRWLEFLK